QWRLQSPLRHHMTWLDDRAPGQGTRSYHRRTELSYLDGQPVDCLTTLLHRPPVLCVFVYDAFSRRCVTVQDHNSLRVTRLTCPDIRQHDADISCYCPTLFG